MNGSGSAVWRILIAGLLTAAFVGCGGKTFEYRPTAGEMKEGPGVLSGKDGEFKVYDTKEEHPAPEEVERKAVESARAADGQPQVNPEETRAYQEFLEWKQREEDSEEYREFKEWQEWKAFQEWKKGKE